jgi:hypothetical protein
MKNGEVHRNFTGGAGLFVRLDRDLICPSLR